MLLAIDVANTNMVFGIYDKGEALRLVPHLHQRGAYIG